MDRLASIPERVLRILCGEKQLTPLSTDVFVSIPERVFAPWKHFFQKPPQTQDYHSATEYQHT